MWMGTSTLKIHNFGYQCGLVSAESQYCMHVSLNTADTIHGKNTHLIKPLRNNPDEATGLIIPRLEIQSTDWLNASSLITLFSKTCAISPYLKLPIIAIIIHFKITELVIWEEVPLIDDLDCSVDRTEEPQGQLHQPLTYWK